MDALDSRRQEALERWAMEPTAMDGLNPVRPLNNMQDITESEGSQPALFLVYQK